MARYFLESLFRPGTWIWGSDYRFGSFGVPIGIRDPQAVYGVYTYFYKLVKNWSPDKVRRRSRHGRADLYKIMVVRLKGIWKLEYETCLGNTASGEVINPWNGVIFQRHSLGKKAAFPYLCRPFTNNGCGDLLVKRIEAVLPDSIISRSFSRPRTKNLKQ